MKKTAMTPSSPLQTVVAFLQTHIARFTRQEPEAIDENAVLIDLGLQSIDAVLLCGEVEDHFRIELDPATIFEHETLLSFAAEVTRRLAAA